MQDILYKNACIKYDTDHGYRKVMVRENVSCIFISCEFSYVYISDMKKTLTYI